MERKERKKEGNKEGKKKERRKEKKLKGGRMVLDFGFTLQAAC